jgi:hypothetical protein
VLRLEVIKRSFDSHPSATIEAQDVFVWRMAVVGTKTHLRKHARSCREGGSLEKFPCGSFPSPNNAKAVMDKPCSAWGRSLFAAEEKAATAKLVERPWL